MDWSIQEVARLAHTTSRTLRHYDELGLLPPSRIGANGYRYYDERALVRLQRILMLRDLGLGLTAIGEVLARHAGEAEALRSHLEWLRQERERLDRQIRSVEDTIGTLEGGEQLMAEKMFDGFDHTRHKEEVEQRWGADAYARGDAGWRGMTAAEKTAWQGRSKQLAGDWQDAAARGVSPDGDEAQGLAGRHCDWLGSIPGTPGGEAAGPTREYVLGLADMYVADERFAANYGGQAGAEFVRAALRVYAERHLEPLICALSRGRTAAGATAGRLMAKNGIVQWQSGPTSNAKSTVPTPTFPPSAQPMPSTTISMPVRTIQILQPVRRCSPVIRPSRGPGPKWAPM